MSKFKFGDKVVAVKDCIHGWYATGDVFKVVDANEATGYVCIRYPDAPAGVLTLPIWYFRLVKTKPLPTIKIRGTDNFRLTLRRLKT